MKSTIVTAIAFVISISTICSTHASPNEVYPQQNNHLRTQSRLNSQNEAIVRGEETEVSHHRKLQPDNQDEVADLLEEVVDLLKETDTPTYSPTKPETEAPTSGMPTYSPTCEDDDCGKNDTPAPVAPAVVDEETTTPPVPTPIVTTDPPVKEVEEDVVDPVDDTTGGDITDETTTDETDTTDKGGDDLNVSGAEGTDTNKSNSLSGGATAGIVIGALAVAGLAAAGIVMAKKRRDAIPSSEDTQDLNSGFVETELVPPPPPPPPSALDSIMKKQGAADENEEVDLARSTSISWKPQPEPDIEQVQSEGEF